MTIDTLPFPLSQKFAYLPFIKKRGTKEWSSACPVCSDAGHIGNDWPDRFRMFDDDKPLGWCRRCGHIEFADDESTAVPDTAKLLEYEEIRRRKAEQESRRLQALIEDFREKEYWKGWHDSMKEPHRVLWRQAGIPDGFQDYWQLGFTQYKSYDFESPALTIPHFATGWKATTMQYRLTNPPAPNDKYRFQAGLKSALWLAEPDKEVKGPVLLCEGMKKAAVAFIELVARGNGRFCVVSVPNKMPGVELLDLLNNADPLYIVLDPDAYTATRLPGGKVALPAVNRLVRRIKAPKRLVKLPVKADDFFTLYGGKQSDFMNYLALGKPV